MKPQQVECEWCGKLFPVKPGRGRKPRFCSEAHRQASHRAKRNAK